MLGAIRGYDHVCEQFLTAETLRVVQHALPVDEPFDASLVLFDPCRRQLGESDQPQHPVPLEDGTVILSDRTGDTYFGRFFSATT